MKRKEKGSKLIKTLILPILSLLEKILRFKPKLRLKSINDVYLQNIKIKYIFYFYALSDFFVFLYN